MYFWDENQVNRTKMEDKTFRHQMPAQLRFSDVDRFGHVNNNVYFSLFDMSKSQYLFDVVGKDIYEHLAIVVAHIESNFITPVYYPEEIYIRTSITHMGNKSFTLHQQAFNYRTKEIKCDCITTMVCFDTKTNKSIPIPDYFRYAVEEYEGYRQKVLVS